MSGGGAAEKPSLPFHCLTNLSKTIGYSAVVHEQKQLTIIWIKKIRIRHVDHKNNKGKGVHRQQPLK